MSRITGPAFAYVVDLPKTQDATRIPEGWNVQWERLCAQDANIPPKICLTHAMSVTFKGIFDQYSTLSQSTCESRFRLGLLGLYALEHHNFEQRWKDASMEDRRKHVLIGLSRSCAIARNLNDARMYCGDVLKLGHLSQDAQVLLNFLQISSPKIAPLYQKPPISFPTPFGIVLKL